MNNFRDFAYSNMKKGLLFRSEGLNFATDEDVAFLQNQGIKIIIDLREEDEREQYRDAFVPDAINISIPLLGKFEPDQREVGVVHVGPYKLPDIADYYRGMVSLSNHDAWTQIFEILLNNPGNAVLFHCGSGKDRTGVVAAMILSALGIDKETIYQDYLLTNQNNFISPDFAKFLETLDEDTRKAFIKYSSANKEYLDAAFEEIAGFYETMTDFFYECCSLDTNKLIKLKEIYLD